VDNIKPKYLAGLVAKVSNIRREKIVVDLSSPTGRFFKSIIVPLSLITKV
jgi:hypothetical protein